MKPDIEGKTPEEFWEDRYASQGGESGGKPTHTLPRFVTGRKPGKALDLGCARGDDVVWLAKQGWNVLGVDLADAALVHAAANAERNGMSDRVRLERHDLAESFPEGTFDLITASFLQTPFDFPWERVIQRAADAIRPRGLLLTVTHQRVAPWSWQPHKPDLPGAEDLLEQVGLPQDDWTRIFVGSIDREASLPDGQRANVTDAVIAIEKGLG